MLREGPPEGQVAARLALRGPRLPCQPRRRIAQPLRVSHVTRGRQHPSGERVELGAYGRERRQGGLLVGHRHERRLHRCDVLEGTVEDRGTRHDRVGLSLVKMH